MTTTTDEDEHDKVPGVPPEIPEDTGSAETARVTKRHVTRVAFVAALGGLLYGYDTGVISGTLIEIGKEFSIGSAVKEFITASILVGAILGALVTGPISAKIGRRRTILLIAGVFGLGVLFAAVSPSPVFLILSRLFLGLAVGGSTQTIPTYIAEIAPGPRRGSLVTVFNCAIGVGILSAAIVGVALNGVVSWRFMIGVAAAPAIVLLLGMLRLPESPRWFVSQDRIGPARRVLRWLRPDHRAAEDELDDIRKLDEAEPSAGAGQWAQLRKPWVRPALIAGLIVAAFTQLTGLEMMIYYTPTILTDAGFPHVYSLWANVGVGVVYLVMTFVGSRLVDRIGRRRLTLVMLPGAAVSIGLFGVLFYVQDGKPSPVLTLVLILAFMFFQAGGIQVVGWLVGSEMYPLRIRAAATSLHAMVLWGANLLVTSTALTLTGWISLGGTMLVYAALNVLGWVLVFLRVPETKGKSLEQIEQSLRDETFLPHRGGRERRAVDGTA
ncbi:sugar porter family MFS transporter [Curtobacterium aurantiacum]|uniref:Sugar porter family MFS transporter n=1 Tax=Curtobacterium aurantiacum TaxID=3236919 RepID=A0ABS5VBP7_9MICO|nr:sugar porter family MFS transporter [Curtobacterium flaccumfaciens]MBT1545613.1 sugar porter family MFS transporter [Curtobacterium flaccumfaciens pv. flaccumfaciens]MBT1586901.1 sugar porter family MFS transporter [Curtobacterium flaccumfaciens pv. flaccumfaciens]